jgi:endo-1,4-beta-xylanase
MKKVILIALTMVPAISCKKEPSVCTADEGLFRRSEFHIGVAINMDKLNEGSVYKNLANVQFNSITAENAFKATYLHPAENTFNWAEADSLAGYCRFHDKRLHGHTLIWHSQVPTWIERFTGNSDQWEHLFKDHIQTIVSHFRGQVTSWDVLNEAFEEDGTLRNTIWKRHLGAGYIERAFKYAHEADPAALLFYNDYQLEGNPVKRKAVLNYFNHLRSGGTRIDGIGLQCHLTTSYPETEQVVEAMREVAEQEFLVHISELDISVNPFTDTQVDDLDTRLKAQADILGKLVLAYKEIDPRFRHGITLWGLGDGDSWIRSHYNRKDYPLLYDDNYLPKPAYCKLKSVL